MLRCSIWHVVPSSYVYVQLCNCVTVYLDNFPMSIIACQYRISLLNPWGEHQYNFLDLRQAQELRYTLAIGATQPPESQPRKSQPRESQPPESQPPESQPPERQPTESAEGVDKGWGLWLKSKVASETLFERRASTLIERHWSETWIAANHLVRMMARKFHPHRSDIVANWIFPVFPLRVRGLTYSVRNNAITCIGIINITQP